MPKTNPVACKIALESKGKVLPDLRAMAAPMVLRGFRQTTSLAYNFAATLAALSGSVIMNDPKVGMPPLPAVIKMDTVHPVSSLPIEQPETPAEQPNNLISTYRNTQSGPTKNPGFMKNILQSSSKKQTIKQDKPQTEVTNVAPESLASAESYISVIPSIQSKLDQTPILKHPPQENSTDITTFQIQDTITPPKHLQFAPDPKVDRLSTPSTEAPLSNSALDTAKVAQTPDTPLTPDVVISPHTMTMSGTADITPPASNEQKVESASAPPLLPSPADQIAPVFLRIKSGEGSRQISLQLTPEALGRVDILIDQPHDGPVVVTVTTSHQHTLDLLKTDQAQLSQALDRSGLSPQLRVIVFHLATPSVHINVPLVGEQQTYAGLTPSMSGAQAQSQFDQGAGSGNQRRPSDTRIPYASSHSFNVDTEQSRQSEDNDPREADASLHYINITA